ncbi:sensor histidine kinase [Methylosinus sp. LW4]|uniref:sensor histidine kinase n=1 Tax=Methylosinus sp. LW4 TaxID=136993 RepID=UPI000378EE54|nr:HAMP domain-containing sensor histidine kinase [Methylosinus sp. LW4]
MTRRRSLSAQLLKSLVAAQISAFAFGWVVSLFLDHYGVLGASDDYLRSYAYTRIQQLLIASLVRDENGYIRIRESAALRAETAKNPDLRYAVFDSERQWVAPGSSPALAADFSALLRYKPNWMQLSLPRSETPDDQVIVQKSDTPFGRLQILIYGHKTSWADMVSAFVHESWRHIYYLVTPLAFGVVVMWFSVQRGLAPIHEFAEAVTRIDLDSLHQRLPDEECPEEFTPLATALNEALQRLDDGAMVLRRFTANAAHELRTPVAILSARLDAPEEPTLKTDLKRDARRIRNIVEQLLAVSRIGAHAEDAFERFDLVETTQAIVSDALLLAYRSNRQIDFVTSAAPVTIRGDRMAIESIVSNVIDNALRAEPSGGAIMVIVDDGPSVSVVDHGAGVAPEDRDRVFEPFWRKSSDATGSGLGLAIGKELMAAHGGRIWIEDTIGGGATFKMAFPSRLAPTETIGR